MDEGNMKMAVITRAGMNTRARMTTRSTRERGKGEDPGTGMGMTKY